MNDKNIESILSELLSAHLRENFVSIVWSQVKTLAGLVELVREILSDGPMSFAGDSAADGISLEGLAHGLGGLDPKDAALVATAVWTAAITMGISRYRIGADVALVILAAVAVGVAIETRGRARTRPRVLEDVPA